MEWQILHYSFDVKNQEITVTMSETGDYSSPGLKMVKMTANELAQNGRNPFGGESENQGGN